MFSSPAWYLKPQRECWLSGQTGKSWHASAASCVGFYLAHGCEKKKQWMESFDQQWYTSSQGSFIWIQLRTYWIILSALEIQTKIDRILITNLPLNTEIGDTRCTYRSRKIYNASNPGLKYQLMSTRNGDRRGAKTLQTWLTVRGLIWMFKIHNVPIGDSLDIWRFHKVPMRC